jgi:hypothetical protein
MRSDTLSRIFFPELEFFAGLSPYSINIAGRISKAAMAGRGARSAPFVMLISKGRRVHAVNMRARAAKIHQFF